MIDNINLLSNKEYISLDKRITEEEKVVYLQRMARLFMDLIMHKPYTLDIRRRIIESALADMYIAVETSQDIDDLKVAITNIMNRYLGTTMVSEGQLLEAKMRRASKFIANIIHLIRRQNMNYIMFLVGDMGKGKSTLAITLSKLIDDSFDENRIVFTPEEFVNVLDEAPKGTAIVWDELGVGMFSRSFQEKRQKAVAKIFEMIRFRNNALFMTLPHLEFADKALRKLAQAMGTVYYADKSHRITYFKPYFIKWYMKSTADGVISRLYPKRITQTEAFYKEEIEDFAISIPLDEPILKKILLKYEKKKEIIFNKLKAKALEIMAEVGEDTNKVLEDLIQKVVKNPAQYGTFRRDRWVISAEKVQVYEKLKPKLARKVKLLSEQILNKTDINELNENY